MKSSHTAAGLTGLAAVPAAIEPTPKDEIACLLQFSPPARRRKCISLGCSLLLQSLLLGGLSWFSRRAPAGPGPRPALLAHVKPLWLSLAPVRYTPARPSRSLRVAMRVPRRFRALIPLPPPRLRRAPRKPLLPAAPGPLQLAQPLRRLAWERHIATPRSPLQLGSFGSPAGLVAVRTPPVPPNVAALGAFTSPGLAGGASAAPAGAGAGRGPSAFTTLAAATSHGGNPSGKALVRTRFVALTAQPAAMPPDATALAPAAAAPAISPPRILYKPRPLYPALARRQRLQGVVVLEALLSATGAVEVLRVVHGLGGGLNRSARTAAQGIRFIPAKINSRPVDWKVFLYISFQLLD